MTENVSARFRIGQVVALVVGVLALLTVIAILYVPVIYPRYLESQVAIGMQRSQVLARFEDKQYSLVDNFTWCESDSWYGDCEALEGVEPAEFFLLKIGIDNWLVVGFDQDERVSFVGRGDT